MFGNFGSIPRKTNPPEQAAIGPAHSVTPNPHNPTPSTLGAVPQNPGQVPAGPQSGVGAVPQSAVHNPTPATLGEVKAHSVPYPKPSRATPSLGAVTTPGVAGGGYARHVWPAPAEKKNRPPLVNYAPGTIKLSILIPTLAARAAMLGELMQRLEYQIRQLGPVPEVEVVLFEDNKENPVGFKRNKLLQDAKGDFVVFVDDDDELSDDYIFQIYTAILDHPKVDAIGLRGIITVNGGNPRQVIYSMHNQGNYESDGIYYRPPCHLTPIRRTIAQRFRFPDGKNFGEDTDYATEILNSKAVKSEFFIDKVLYHYRYNASLSQTAPGLTPPNRLAQPTYSIVILSAIASNLRMVLSTILEKEPLLPRNRIIVVDDGARYECENEFPGVTWVSGLKPFIFARNANIGIRAAGSDVLLLNDDAKLLTKFGFTSLSFAARSRPDVGICSAAISGVVGNPNQTPWLVAAGMRYEPGNLAFVSVYIPKATYDRVGPLDERFVGYGFEDNDYCLRAKKSSLAMAIYDGCVVEHAVAGNSTFRTKPEIHALMEQNRQLFRQKWPGSGV